MPPDHELGPPIEMLAAKFEGWLAPKPPWTTSKMTAGRLDAMKKTIVGLVMTVGEIEGSFKLNQHKSDVDHLAVASALSGPPPAPPPPPPRPIPPPRPPPFPTQP